MKPTTHTAGGGLDNPHPGIHTDLYQLTMAAAYFAHGMDFTSSFELSVRRLPRERGYLIAAGLEQALDYTLGLRFSAPEIAYLRSLPVLAGLDPKFFEMLREFRFTGSIKAAPEGTAIFPHEPILQVTAPVVQAQILETYLLSMINFQTLIATKAARTVEAARGRSVVEFGLRRAHGPGAGDLAARASYVGGCAGTSNVLAGMRYGIPVVGTAAHSWTLANPSEEEAFRRYHQTFPQHAILLVDTYDTLAGTRRAMALGKDLRGVRLDSGDLLALSREVRRMLDEGGLRETKVVISGDLNEYKIDEMLAQGAPVDVFGVGTELVTSRDEPALGGVYKLVETLEGGKRRFTMKFSTDKITLPARKQVFRRAEGGRAVGDVIALEDEALAGRPLLVPQVAEGRRLHPAEPLEVIRARAREELAALPEGCRRIRRPEAYPVAWSPGLTALVETLRRESDAAAANHA